MQVLSTPIMYRTPSLSSILSEKTEKRGEGAFAQKAPCVYRSGVDYFPEFTLV